MNIRFDQNANAWKARGQIGRPGFPSLSQIEILQRASLPPQELSKAESENGRIKVDFTPTQNEITLFEINLLEDESESYFGLDDTKLPGF